MAKAHPQVVELAHYLPGRVRFVIALRLNKVAMEAVAAQVAQRWPVERIEANPWARSLTFHYVPSATKAAGPGRSQAALGIRANLDPLGAKIGDELAAAVQKLVGAAGQSAPAATGASVGVGPGRVPASSPWEPENRPLELQIAQVALTGTLLAAVGAANARSHRRGVAAPSPPRWFNLSALISIISGYPQLKSGLGQLARGRINYDLLLALANLILITLNRNALALLAVWLENLLALAESLVIIGSRRTAAEAIEREEAHLFPGDVRGLEPTIEAEAEAETKTQAEAKAELVPCLRTLFDAQVYAEKETARAGGVALLTYALSRRPDRALAVLLSSVPAAAVLAGPATYSLATVRASRRGLKVYRTGALAKAGCVDALLLGPEIVALPGHELDAAAMKALVVGLKKRGISKVGLAVAGASESLKARVEARAQDWGVELADSSSRYQAVESWCQQGLSVGYVGVARQDIAALRRADLGISFREAPAAVRVQAGLVLETGLAGLLELFDRALEAKRIGAQGLTVAKGFNLSGMALSLAGVLSPAWAAYWNHLALLAVIANAGRISRGPVQLQASRLRSQPRLADAKSGSKQPRALPCPQARQLAARTEAIARSDFLAKALGTDLDWGLTMREAKWRWQAYGPNLLPQLRPVSFWYWLGEQFRGFGTGLLLGSALLSLILGRVADAGAIILVVGLNAGIGAWQSYKSDRALEALQQIAPSRALVIRGGRPRSLPTSQLVPGDILLLREGEVIAADARVVESDGLAVDEAPLTGESFPVTKKSSTNGNQDEDLRSLLVFSGTHVVRGQGRALVLATGPATEMGRLTFLMSQPGRRRLTALERRLDRVNRTLVKGSLAAAAVVGASTRWRGAPLSEALMNGISLAVAAIPEGVTVMVSLALAIGALRMARVKVMAQKLSAVETLGQATIICTDKTGTLTGNRLTVTQVYADGKNWDLDAAEPGEWDKNVQLQLCLLAGFMASQEAGEANGHPGNGLSRRAAAKTPSTGRCGRQLWMSFPAVKTCARSVPIWDPFLSPRTAPA